MLDLLLVIVVAFGAGTVTSTLSLLAIDWWDRRKDSPKWPRPHG